MVAHYTQKARGRMLGRLVAHIAFLGLHCSNWNQWKIKATTPELCLVVLVFSVNSFLDVLDFLSIVHIYLTFTPINMTHVTSISRSLYFIQRTE